MNIYKIGLMTLPLLMFGCGGGSGSGSTPAATNTGVFLDSAVASIGYTTASQSGTTNSSGEYKYLPGETVTFSIGDLSFPAVTASSTVTPADIAAGDSTLQTNILQVLQTLDSDGDPSNGIEIHADAAAAFTGNSFDLSSASFDSDVTSTLTTISASLTLVDETTANAHFESTLQDQILGSWLYSEGAGKRNILTFIDATRYIIIHEHSDDPGVSGSQTAGSVEYGTYTWNPTTGALTSTLHSESDGWGGLVDAGSSVISGTITDNTLTITFPDGVADFTQVTNNTNALVGAWILGSGDDINVLTFLSASEYVIAHSLNAEGYTGESAQALSGEFGTYTYNSSSSAFVATNVTVDSDGNGGLYNAEDSTDQANETLVIDSSGNLIFTDNDEGSFLFTAIKVEDNIPSGTLTGLWRSTTTTNDFVSVTFFDDGTYVYSVYDSDSIASESGMELGTYVLNGTTDILYTIQTLDNNQGRGLSEDITHFASISANTLTLSFDDNGNNIIDAGESVDFTKTNPTGEVGVWRSFATANDFVSIALFADGVYVYTVYDSNSILSESGMELGTYTLNATTDILNSTQTLDNNQGRGISETITHFASVSGNTLTLSFDDNGNNTIDTGESVDFVN